MSHCLGVICAACREVLVLDSCPERDCPGGHGYGYQAWNDWARRMWPQHTCPREEPTEA